MGRFGEERYYFTSQVIVHHQGSHGRKELKQEPRGRNWSRDTEEELFPSLFKPVRKDTLKVLLPMCLH